MRSWSADSRPVAQSSSGYEGWPPFVLFGFDMKSHIMCYHVFARFRLFCQAFSSRYVNDRQLSSIKLYATILAERCRLSLGSQPLEAHRAALLGVRGRSSRAAAGLPGAGGGGEGLRRHLDGSRSGLGQLALREADGFRAPAEQPACRGDLPRRGPASLLHPAGSGALEGKPKHAFP